MTKIDEYGAITMDTDFAPKNSTYELKHSDTPVKYIVLLSSGVMEDYSGVIIEDTEEIREAIKREGLKIIASGVSEVSLGELSYALQSPTRQLYRATMADLAEFAKNRFTGDDSTMREILNNSN